MDHTYTIAANLPVGRSARKPIAQQTASPTRTHLISFTALFVAAFCCGNQSLAQSLPSESVLDTITVTGTPDEREDAPGSVQVVEKDKLEQWRYTDIHRILNDSPGVYVRQEDGWGLRPNIGMRGSGSDRSKKIALTEDGILFSPAPYSAPAAYYFPALSRIQSVEVFKGPASIRNGPNTVGGIINFVSRAIPGTLDADHLNGALDLTVGTLGVANVHGYYGANSDRWGYLLEGVHLQADGFQEIDDGSDSGFSKNDAIVKLRFNSDPSADIYHQVDIKAGYADEVSQQSYLGLSDADFASTPYRRYAGGQQDEMQWDHQQLSVAHYLDTGGDFTINTTLYHRQFFRLWDKLNGFSDDAPDLQTILSNPDSAINSVYYDVLTGARDSSSPSETLVLGANERDFFSRGIQSTLELDIFGDSAIHKLSLGVRFHEDEINRHHTQNGYRMSDGRLVSDDNPTRTGTLNSANSKATALFVHDKIEWNDLVITGGVRGEFISSRFTDKLTTNGPIDREQNVWIPGIGFTYRWTPNLRLIGGIHKGFVPFAPGSDDAVKPEESINQEIGIRYSGANAKAELIGFFNDYSNLSGTCTFSSGCATSQLDRGFNAGEVDIYGIEAQIKGQISTGIENRMRFPLQLSWTYTDSKIKNNFTSPNPDLNDVRIGDQLPYIPEHQIALNAGIQRFDWQAAVSIKYVSSMRTSAGQGTPAARERTQSNTVVDATARYQLSDKQQLHLGIRNVFDTQAITARRPYGIRGSLPRSLTLGYKIDF